jgi:hypothetical protein
MRLPCPPRRVWIVTLATVVLTTLPYLVGASSAPPGTTFSGAILDLPDYNSHLAKMQQGARGDWLYQLLFTAEPHQPVLLQTFYVALGHVVRWSGLSLDVVYQLARVVCTMLMVWAVWAFMAHFLPDKVAWWALLLCLFGGGMGYLLFWFAPNMTANVSPIEFWLLDAYTFLAAFASPHLAAGIALLALACLSLDRWTSRSEPGSVRARHALPLLTLFLSLLAVALVQPFDLLLLDGILIAAVARGILRRQMSPVKALAGLALIGISHMAIVGYDWIVLSQYPVWQSFAAQNVTLSPPPVYYLLGYAPILLPALGGIVLALRRRAGLLFVPICWILGVAALVYAPLATQRRFVLGVLVPMAALAVYWLANVALPWLRDRLRRRYRLVLVVYGAVATLTTITLLAWLLVTTRSTLNPDLYIPDEDRAAWNWIADHAPVDSVVLAAFTDGGNLAARTGRWTVLGHWIETTDYSRKKEDVRRFFSVEADDAWRLSFLRAQHVAYVWYGAEEQRLGDWSPATASFLRPVFETSTVRVFRFEGVS